MNFFGQLSTFAKRLSHPITNINLSLLDGTLSKSFVKQLDLQRELQIYETLFVNSGQTRKQLAYDLFIEQRSWKISLQEAEERKDAAASLYIFERVSLNMKIQRTREMITLSSNQELIESLESQFSRLMEMKSQLISATQEVDIVKERSQRINELIKRFQEARDHHHKSSVQYYSIRDHLMEVNKHIGHVKQLVQSFKNDEQSILPQVLTPRFWIKSIQVFAIGSRN